MTLFSDEKSLVLDHYRVLDAAEPGTLEAAIDAHAEDGFRWLGMHTFHEQWGAEAVAASFWEPVRASVRHLQRRRDTFFAGRNDAHADEGAWVCSMGHLMGLFDTAGWAYLRPAR